MNYSDTVVILAAGRGSRMNTEIPKVLLQVAGKPILRHVIDFWQDKVERFIFVVGYKRENVIEFLGDIKTQYSQDFHIVTQEKQMGIANAILQAENWIDDRFIVALGDCLHIGNIEEPGSMDMGYVVWCRDYQKALGQGCTVTVNWRGNITDIEEKPCIKEPGLGVYYFNRKVFDYIKRTPESNVRNEVEISDVIRQMILAGETIKAVEFQGDYINFTRLADIEYAEKLLRMGAKSR